jgi:hypothetical protein
MLAWVHQATASEHELLESLFGVGRNRVRMVGEERSAERSEAEQMVSDALDKNLDGLGRPLKLRIEQTIKSQEGIIMTYRIVNLVQFYLVTMRKTIGPGAVLSQALQEWVPSRRDISNQPDCTTMPTRLSLGPSKRRAARCSVFCM